MSTDTLAHDILTVLTLHAPGHGWLIEPNTANPVRVRWNH